MHVFGRAYVFSSSLLNSRQVIILSQINSLTNAKYIEYAPSGLYTNTDNYTVSGINYDLNGNIQQLNRRGFNGSGFSQIDQMSYTYENNSNILKSVSDAAQVTDRGFKEIGNNTIDYQYDDNGNLTRDNNKGIDIFYNLPLELPKEMVMVGHKIFTT